ncbi:hypothetical protein [Phormidium nigroviride]
MDVEELSRRKKEEGRRKNVYTVNFLAVLSLCLIRWIYLFQFHQKSRAW